MNAILLTAALMVAPATRGDGPTPGRPAAARCTRPAGGVDGRAAVPALEAGSLPRHGRWLREEDAYCAAGPAAGAGRRA